MDNLPRMTVTGERIAPHLFTRNVIIPFTGPQPSAYDSLGEIKWNCLNPFCHTCQRDLRAGDVYFRLRYYDGCHWEQPTCVYCNTPITDCNYPDDENERRIFITRGAMMGGQESDGSDAQDNNSKTRKHVVQHWHDMPSGNESQNAAREEAFAGLVVAENLESLYGSMDDRIDRAYQRDIARTRGVESDAQDNNPKPDEMTP